MGDQDFNFRPPVERREPKQFEPPPWERDAFDELSRAKAAEAAAAEEAAAAQEAAAEAAAARDAAAQQTTEVGVAADGGASVGADGATVAASAASETAAQAPAEPKVSEAQLTEMMAGLRAEEPTSMENYSTIALVLSAFTGLVGVVMLIWAMAMFVSSSARGTGRVGIISGSIVAIFGALFIGLSIWVAVRTLRQRGVL